MPLLAGVTAPVVTDMDALVAGGWQVEVVNDDAGATVALTKPLVFVAATEAEALAAARQHVDAGGGV